MAAQPPDGDHLLELLSPFGQVELRRMFGAWGVYLDGLIVGLVVDDGIFLKTDLQTRAAFESSGGTPFVYRSKARTVATSYWSLPVAAMDSPEAMRPWAQLALDAARRKASVAGATSTKRRRP